MSQQEEDPTVTLLRALEAIQDECRTIIQNHLQQIARRCSDSESLSVLSVGYYMDCLGDQLWRSRTPSSILIDLRKWSLRALRRGE